MSDLHTQIAISADASGVEAGVGRAKKSLAQLGQAGADAGQQAAQGVAAIGAGGDTSAQAVDRTARSLISSIQRTTAALEAGSRSSADYYRVLANQRGVDANLLAPYLAALDGVEARQRSITKATEATQPVVKQLGMSARQTAAALRGVPAQFTDIVTSLQGGQAPLTVMLQQGGQLKDMFGGVGNATRALGGYILSLVNPLTVTLAGVAALTYAFHEGAAEQQAYQKALIMSGNLADTTSGQLQVMAQSISAVVGTQGNAAQALTAFAQSGAAGAESLERYTLAAIKFERSTGQAVADTVKQFAELKKAPLEASLKLNESTNYLTESLYKQIKAYAEQGRATDAANLAQKAYADTLSTRSTEMLRQLGFVERAWLAIKDAAKGAGDAVLEVGRSDGLDVQIAKQREQVERLKKLRSTKSGSEEQRIGVLEGRASEKLASLEEINRLETRRVENLSEQGRRVAALAQWEKSGEQFATNTAKMKKEILRAENEGIAAGAKRADIESRIADIRKKYTDKGDVTKGNSVINARAGLDIERIQKSLDAQLGAYANAERILDAARSAGLVSEADYYAAKRQFVENNAAIQDKALGEEIARESARKALGTTKAEKDLAQIEIDKKVLELESKRSKAAADTAASLQVLAIQQNAALASTTRAYEEARQAAQAYLDTSIRAYQRDLEGYGRGDEFRNRSAGRNQIEDKYAKQRQDVTNQRALDKDQSPENLAKYQRQLDLIDEFRTKALTEWDKYYDSLKKKQGDWASGAQRALENYADNASNTFKQTENLVGNAFKGMEDALTSFVMTGKADFASLAQSILSDLARIQIQKALASTANTASDVFASFVASANGNVFQSPGLSAYSGQVVSTPTLFPFAKGVGLMGEAGPEAIMPLSRGANGKLGVTMSPSLASAAKSGDVYVTVNVDAGGTSAQGDSPNSQQLGAVIGSAVRSVLVQEKRPGGLLSA